MKAAAAPHGLCRRPYPEFGKRPRRGSSEASNPVDGSSCGGSRARRRPDLDCLTQAVASRQPGRGPPCSSRLRSRHSLSQQAHEALIELYIKIPVYNNALLIFRE